MKYLLLIIPFVGVAVSNLSDDIMADWNAVIAPHMPTCAQESGVNPVLTQSMFDNGKLRNEDELQCFLKCAAEKGGFLENGKVNRDFILQSVPHVAEDTLDNCIKSTGSIANECTKIYRLGLCVSESKYS